MKFFTLIFLCTLVSFNANAQLNQTSHWEVSPAIGPLLPSSISGVSESLMMTGARIGKGMSYYRPEILYAQGSESGISYQLFILSFKNPIYLSGAEDIRPFFLAGLQMSQYEPVINGATSAKETGNGFHLGFGLELDISKTAQIRNDYYFANGPGRVLLATLAIQIQFGGENNEGPN